MKPGISKHLPHVGFSINSRRRTAYQVSDLAYGWKGDSIHDPLLPAFSAIAVATHHKRCRWRIDFPLNPIYQASLSGRQTVSSIRPVLKLHVVTMAQINLPVPADQ